MDSFLNPWVESEDAERSTVARELLRWKSDEVFDPLSSAATQRATSGLI
jgi:hypothetical protein